MVISILMRCAVNHYNYPEKKNSISELFSNEASLYHTFHSFFESSAQCAMGA